MKRGVSAGGGVRLLRAWLAAMFQVIFLCGFAIVLLAMPLSFRHYYRGKGAGETADAEKIVQWLSSKDPMTSMNTRLHHGQLGEKELNHYTDVRRFFGKFPMVCVVSLIMWGTMIQKEWNRDFLMMIQVRALAACAILILSAWALAIWDWRTLFAWIHYPFFGATSWRFPTGAYSLRLFPANFWKMMGIVVVLTPIVISGGVAFSLKAFRRKTTPFVG